MAALVNRKSQIANPDWLWHFLQRVPADEALLRASEAQIVEALDLPQPCSDFRDEFGRGQLLQRFNKDAACAIYAATGETQTSLDFALNEIQTHLAEDRLLLVFADAQLDSAENLQHIESLAQTLNANNFTIERWLPYFDQDAHAASANLRSTWPALFLTTTGHYVPLPWKRFLNPLQTQLQPHYDAAPDQHTHCVCFLARKSAEPVLQELPPSQPIDLHIDTPANDAPVEHPTTNVATSEISAAAAPEQKNRVAIAPALLVAAALLFAFATQQIMTGSPDSIAGSVFLWGFALIALAGLRLVKSRADGRPSFGRNLPSFTSNQLIRAAIYAVALVFSLAAQAQSRAIFVAVPLWLLAIALAFYALYKPGEEPSLRAPLPPGEARRGLLLPITITLIALIIRFWKLTEHPWILNGIETQLGLEALAVSDPFASGWLTNPTLPLYFTKGAMAIFGRTAFALRVLSPLVGTATVAAIYLIGSRLWNKRVGLLAAILLAGSHTHIHYSRLGMTNIWDPLLVLLAMGGIAVAWQHNRRLAWLAVGAAAGAAAYFFTALHLLPLMLLALLIVMLVGNSAELKTRRRNLTASGGFALVIALPIIRFYQQRPELFMERADILGIEKAGWLAQQMQSGDSIPSIYLQQFWQSLFSFNALIDTDASYKPDVPLVNWLVGILLLIGIGMAIAHLRQPRYAVLLVTFLVTVIFGGALLVDLPHSRRLIIALPAVILLAACSADWLLSFIPIKRITAYGLLITVLLGLLDVGFYFGRYQSQHTFADRNTEVAQGIATYLNELEGENTVYLHGAPQMYVSFSTIPFLVTDYQSGFNLHDILPEQPNPPPLTDNIVHLFTPDHFDSIPAIMESFPDGEFRQIDGFHANPLFVAYEYTIP